MGFKTKLDYSNNRQIKQHLETLTTLSGGTSFGLPFANLTKGPNLATSGETEQYTLIASTFSGNNTTTIYTWYDPRMELGHPYLSALTPTTSAETQTVNPVFAPSSSVIIDGNLVNTAFTGVTFDLYNIIMTDLGGGNYAGTVEHTFFDVLSANTAEYTGRTIWADVSGITRTDRLIVTNTPVIGNVLTCIDSEGMASWQPAGGGGSGGTSYWSAGTGTDSLATLGGGNIASNDYSLASGYLTISSGQSSFSQGVQTIAGGHGSHAEGNQSHAMGNNTHAEGFRTQALWQYSHAEGRDTITNGEASHAEGNSTEAIGNYSHSEGYFTKAIGWQSHAEGNGTTAFTDSSHVEGYQTQATGATSHAEGTGSIAGGLISHAEGQTTKALGNVSHAEGSSTIALGTNSHAEGQQSQAIGYVSHAQGYFTIASGDYSHAGGYQSDANGIGSFIHGYNSMVNGNYSIVLGQNITGNTANTTYVDRLNIKTLGGATLVNNLGIDANGYVVIGTSGSGGTGTSYWGSGSGINSLVVLGASNTATGDYSLVEGRQNQASGAYSHAEGLNTKAIGFFSHAQGEDSEARGSYSHAEGSTTIASGTASHAGGSLTQANGSCSFVHGSASTANGNYSIVLGRNITGATDDTTYVDHLTIKSVLAGPGTIDLGVDINGNVVNQASDIRLKENINTIENALDKVMNLRGVSYQWKDRVNGGDAVRLGFIAQEVQEITPELVTENGEYLGVQYKDVPALLVEAIKELVSGNTEYSKTYLETQTIQAEDNNIELNFNGTLGSSVGGGVTIIRGEEEASNLLIDTNGNWVSNVNILSKGFVIPEYTPTSSQDSSGIVGNIVQDDDYIYIKRNSGWKRTPKLEDF